MGSAESAASMLRNHGDDRNRYRHAACNARTTCARCSPYSTLSIRAGHQAACACDNSDGACGLDVLCTCYTNGVYGLPCCRRVAKRQMLRVSFRERVMVDIDTACGTIARMSPVGRPLRGHHFWEVDVAVAATDAAAASQCAASDVALGVWTTESQRFPASASPNQTRACSRKMVCVLSSTGMLHSNGVMYRVAAPFSAAKIAMHVDAGSRRVSFAKNARLVCTAKLRGNVFRVLLRATARQCSARLCKVATIDYAFSLQYLCCCALRKAVRSRDPYNVPIPDSLKETLKRLYPWLLCIEYAAVLNSDATSLTAQLALAE